ncbi:TetR family transcriptional regulator [Brevundimonas goettingensis]|uniref:TetR family transcriptional regulator n=1 Tax=Brevundimonas goettingensis TaxID=2774190 RepID=A0A975C4D7_9CAUL|nr:TetR family transcriptional regulator [Brevundimonas goettingensis]QTC91086.1 TetR family transcriptional regulator [Brevundimonas goettingensis]
MAESGLAGATARTVAARAGSSPSAINYHFDSIERLYGIAQQQAISEARLWLAARLAEVDPGAPWGPAAFPAFAATVIDDWCATRRVLAQAEACDCAALAWRVSDTAGQWLSLWEGFWAAALPRFSLPVELAPVAAGILQSERFGHLARWRTPYDRAGLEEVCTRLAARLSGDAELLARPAPWRTMAETLSQQATVFPPLTGAEIRITQAVVEAVDEGGESAFTHRAAAVGAGLSLGAVTYHFPTRAALMAAGYAWLYQTIVISAQRSGVISADHDDLGRHILAFLDVGQSAPRARAFETFFFSATRDPALADFAARVRYSRGLSTLGFLSPVAPQLTRLDALLISHWISGAARASKAGATGAEGVKQALAAQAAAMFPRTPAV